MFAIVFLSRADRATNARAYPAEQSAGHVIRILDQNGRPAVNGMPSGTGPVVPVTVGGRKCICPGYR